MNALTTVAEVVSDASDWNILTTAWAEVLLPNGSPMVASPLDILRRGSGFHRVVSANPLDVFALHRFLLTLLYWKAEKGGGVSALRKSLLSGAMPDAVLEAVEAEQGCFRLFDSTRPFLQDVTVRDSKTSTPGYLFAEMASGTNVAHFHHGDDDNTRLCLNCVSRGLLRLVPWTQSGGAGKTPAIHGAPPITLLALGATVWETLGLNFVEVDCELGKPNWSGHFKPSSRSGKIPLLEGFTWNPRRVNLLGVSEATRCSRCGALGQACVGPIVYEKNETTGKTGSESDCVWTDPAAFYRSDKPHSTFRSGREHDGATGWDIRRLAPIQTRKGVIHPPTAMVQVRNSGHGNWLLVVPCTNPANNKSFDHRWIETPCVPPTPAPSGETAHSGDQPQAHPKPLRPHRVASGVHAFIRIAARLTHEDWSELRSAQLSSMQERTAAFDILTGILWGLRGRVSGLPDRQAMWMTLKLMGFAGQRRFLGRSAQPPIRLWESLPRLQPGSGTFKPGKVRYPVGVPRGRRLELELQRIIIAETKRNSDARIDWAGLCAFLGNEST